MGVWSARIVQKLATAQSACRNLRDVWLAREGALNNLSPALGARAERGVRKCRGNARPRRRPLQNLALSKHFGVAASAATGTRARPFSPRRARG